MIWLICLLTSLDYRGRFEHFWQRSLSTSQEKDRMASNEFPQTQWFPCIAILILNHPFLFFPKSTAKPWSRPAFLFSHPGLSIIPPVFSSGGPVKTEEPLEPVMKVPAPWHMKGWDRDMACGVVIWLCYRLLLDHHESDLCRQHVFASWWSATPGLEVWKKCTGLRERRPWILSQDSKTLPCFNAVGKFTRFNLCQEHGENPDRQWTKIGCFCSDHWRCCKARSFQRFEDGTFVRAVEWSWTSSKKPFT